MQNINPIFILQPVIVITLCSLLMVYWYRKHRFHGMIWLYTLIAYGGAIAAKYALQLPTIGLVIGSGEAALGLYYGVQTVVFEVGFAYLVAYLAFKRGSLDRRDAEAFGSGLGFWENVGFLSALSLVNLIAYYAILSGGSSLATTLYEQLSTNAPSLFASDVEALGLVGIGVLERISSLLVHVAWGYLCVMAVIYRKKALFAIALPMGLIDFLVPFASANVLVFEVAFFALAVVCIIVAWYATKRLIKQPKTSQTMQSIPTQQLLS
ncbi:YhfC family intramembrane metalloprotease [Candidatus Bathyarchaeota archaeon]|nr:YhfC family intramembrane metalloprotease [Candidatus Bathyarchaeota archaeon]